MKKITNSEIIILLLALIPSIYLAFIWNELPEKVPMHWNIKGEIDRYGSKQQLIWLSLLLPLSTYFILSIIPKIDPKNQLAKMGNKYESFKFFFVMFMSLVSGVIIYASYSGSIFSPKYILIAVSGLFMILGNYMKTLKPNYFVGIRTPWTLENKEVWKKTHYIASYLWFFGGLISMLAAFFLPQKAAFYFFMLVTAIIAIFPMVYSYLIFQKNKKDKA